MEGTAQAARQELIDLAQTRHGVREVQGLMARQIHLFRRRRQVRRMQASQLREGPPETELRLFGRHDATDSGYNPTDGFML
jgi:hypothetical protein